MINYISSYNHVHLLWRHHIYSDVITARFNPVVQVKKDSALTEAAWNGAGQEVGLQIWRINKFKVEHWDKAQYGDFYNGDSYIVLNTYKYVMMWSRGLSCCDHVGYHVFRIVKPIMKVKL